MKMLKLGLRQHDGGGVRRLSQPSSDHSWKNNCLKTLGSIWKHKEARTEFSAPSPAPDNRTWYKDVLTTVAPELQELSLERGSWEDWQWGWLGGKGVKAGGGRHCGEQSEPKKELWLRMGRHARGIVASSAVDHALALFPFFLPRVLFHAEGWKRALELPMEMGKQLMWYIHF